MEAQDIITTIRKLGDQMLTLADLLEKKPAPKESTSKESTSKEAEPEEKGSVVLPKLEDVRSVLADISRRGKTAEMKELLSQFGAAKLSDIKPEDYPSLLSAAKEIANA